MGLPSTRHRRIARASLSIALGAALALPTMVPGPTAASPLFDAGGLVVSSTNTAAPGTGLRLIAPVAAVGMKLGSWRGYTRQVLLPDFGARFGFRYEIDLGLLANHEYLLLPGFATGIAPQTSTRFTFDLAQGLASHLEPVVARLGTTPSPMLREPQGLALDRVLFAPGLRSQLSDDVAIDVAAVFANQRFSSWGMGFREASDRFAYVSPGFYEGFGGYADPGLYDGLREASAGTGVRFGFTSELTAGLALDLGFQSRIEMDAFQTYRGVYSEPGDFDIPASASVGLAVRASSRSSVHFDVQRVLYSEVNAFTTAALPDRFLSLLGDAGSPEFSWDDLTVYRVAWRYAASPDLDWRVQYSSRQQPTPSSALLAQALAPEIADSNVTVGFSRRAGRDARIDVNASYAPSEYFLGTANFGRTPDLGDEQLEFEVRLVWDF